MIKTYKAFVHCFKEARKSLRFRYFNRKDKWGHIGKNTVVHSPSMVSGKQNIFLGDNVNIDWDNVIYAVNARFIVKDNSGAAVGLKVITGNHRRAIGEKKGERGNRNLEGKDVIVEEDVWIAANVTLLAGVHIGRGSIIGAGSVLRTCNIPPYAIVMGNPGKIVGFRYTPEEILQHEMVLYEEENRLSIDLLNKNYQKYYISRIKEIKKFVTL